MKTYLPSEGQKILLDNEIICEKVCSPDDFDGSRIQYISNDEAERIRQEQESELEGGQDVNSN